MRLVYVAISAVFFGPTITPPVSSSCFGRLNQMGWRAFGRNSPTVMCRGRRIWLQWLIHLSDAESTWLNWPNVPALLKNR